MPYVIGVDGGQTSTTAILVDGTGRALGLGVGGPANHIHEPGGVERVQRSVSQAIEQARRAAGLPNAPVALAYLGMTGSSAAVEEACRAVVPAERLILGHDTRIALHTITLGGPGVVVIAGTGSAACGRSPDGRVASMGGWGYILGDEGSGYWIAVRGLNACFRAADGLGPPTALTDRVPARLGVGGLGDVHHLVYSSRLPRPEMAALSTEVGEAARAGDRVSAGILRAAGRELARFAVGVMQRLDMLSTNTVVGTFGGVYAAGAAVLSPFRQVVRRACPGARILGPRVSAPMAAALLGLEALGVSVDPAIAEERGG